MSGKCNLQLICNAFTNALRCHNGSQFATRAIHAASNLARNARAPQLANCLLLRQRDDHLNK
eukprot:6581853-Lingulodinium_polyedra.AAC.1